MSSNPIKNKLSVVIVNYNVEFFLEQCLHSVMKAASKISTEIFVVDNNSVDGSVQMVKDKFSTIICIENKDNKGFSFANNQAIKIATGEYILLLNPDTVVEEDTFEKVVAFMDKHHDAGGLGVKMIDGKGNFLPESKRGLPTPTVAFYKIFGIASLFPKSKIFGKYHLGFLDKESIHEIEILSGAFMLMRKKTLDKVGLLDENFFMYGEDIDLSYRIIKGGYKNYYFPETSIIHYKGESTKKSSVNYVIVFYKAMVIFAQKHFSQKNAKTFSFLINIAIYLRAAAAIVTRFLQRMVAPVIDSLVIFIGIYLIKNYYEQYIKQSDSTYYPTEYMCYVVPAYILVWLFSVFLAGGYDKPLRLLKIVNGLMVGTAIILIVYALLPEQYRYSRGLILLGALWSLLSMFCCRFAFHLSGIKKYSLTAYQKKRIVIVGSEEEVVRVNSLLNQTSINVNLLGFISSNETRLSDKRFIGKVSQLQEIIQVYKIEEVVFCSKDLTVQQIIYQMSLNCDIDYKIAPPESLYLIGSSSIHTSGDLYTIDINSISKPDNVRNKRVLDILTSLLLLICSPVLLFFVHNQIQFLINIFRVLFGNLSWVGYANEGDILQQKLPDIKKGILTPADSFSKFDTEANTVHRLNVLYSKDYSILNDLSILWHSFREIGRT